MIAAFVHELKILETEDGSLYLRGYNTSYWERYLRFFDQLYVTGRKFKATKEQVKGLDILNDKKIAFYEVQPVHSFKTRITNYLNVKSSIKKLVQKVDFIIARQPGTYADMVISEAKKYNKKYLIEMVGCPWDSLWHHSFAGKVVAPFSVLKTKANVKEAPYVVYVTKKFLQSRYPTDGINTNCSNVTLPQLDAKTLDDRLEHIDAIKERKLLLGTVAAVDVKYKGQQYVIEALGKMKKQGESRFEYHLVGGGDQSFLKQIADENGVAECVVFHGSLKHDDVFTFLDRIDVYVQPSLQEGLPRALIEAMSRGLTCLGAHTGGIPELLEERFVFSNKSSRIDEIISILNSIDTDILKKQSERNFKEALRYEAEKIDARRKQIFEQAINEIR